MAGDDDFTFCQVGLQDGQDLLLDINGIAIKDNVSLASCSSHNDGILLNNSSSTKQEKVGSLSFNVIDVSSSKQSNKSSRQVVSGDPGNSVENPEKQKTVARKPIVRAKVPFEKGYSQMDWLKLTRTHPDLAGLKGQSNKRLISLSEVKQHQTEDCMWTVLKGRVYNISPYMKFHPGGINIILNIVHYKQLVGVDMLMKAVGKDSTSLFNKYHAWVNFEFLLEKCLVGTLDDGR